MVPNVPTPLNSVYNNVYITLSTCSMCGRIRLLYSNLVCRCSQWLSILFLLIIINYKAFLRVELIFLLLSVFICHYGQLISTRNGYLCTQQCLILVQQPYKMDTKPINMYYIYGAAIYLSVFPRSDVAYSIISNRGVFRTLKWGINLRIPNPI